MASECRYKLTKKAEADLDDIVSYIAVELANPKAASDFLDKLENVIEEARTFPESGSAVTNDFLPVANIKKEICWKLCNVLSAGPFDKNDLCSQNHIWETKYG